MSQALVCDQCDTMLIVNARGESDTGEEAGWLKIVTTWITADVCSRACAIAHIESSDFAEAHDAGLEAITAVALAIRDADEGDDGG